MSNDNVNHPEHYKSGGLEAIDVIEAFGLSKSFNLGNACKYLLRAGKKGNIVEDLKKAIWYLQRHLINIENENNIRRTNEESKQDEH